MLKVLRIGNERKVQYNLFLEQLDELMTSHAGKSVLFANGQVQDVFGYIHQAYEEGTRRYGERGIFVSVVVADSDSEECHRLESEFQRYQR